MRHSNLCNIIFSLVLSILISSSSSTYEDTTTCIDEFPVKCPGYKYLCGFHYFCVQCCRLTCGLCDSASADVRNETSLFGPIEALLDAGNMTMDNSSTYSLENSTVELNETTSKNVTDETAYLLSINIEFGSWRNRAVEGSYVGLPPRDLLLNAKGPDSEKEEDVETTTPSPDEYPEEYPQESISYQGDKYGVKTESSTESSATTERSYYEYYAESTTLEPTTRTFESTTASTETLTELSTAVSASTLYTVTYGAVISTTPTTMTQAPLPNITSSLSSSGEYIETLSTTTNTQTHTERTSVPTPVPAVNADPHTDTVPVEYGGTNAHVVQVLSSTTTIPSIIHGDETYSKLTPSSNSTPYPITSTFSQLISTTHVFYNLEADVEACVDRLPSSCVRFAHLCSYNAFCSRCCAKTCRLCAKDRTTTVAAGPRPLPRPEMEYPAVIEFPQVGPKYELIDDKPNATVVQLDGATSAGPAGRDETSHLRSTTRPTTRPSSVVYAARSSPRPSATGPPAATTLSTLPTSPAPEATTSALTKLMSTTHVFYNLEKGDIANVEADAVLCVDRLPESCPRFAFLCGYNAFCSRCCAKSCGLCLKDRTTRPATSTTTTTRPKISSTTIGAKTAAPTSSAKPTLGPVIPYVGLSTTTTTKPQKTVELKQSDCVDYFVECPSVASLCDMHFYYRSICPLTCGLCRS